MCGVRGAGGPGPLKLASSAVVLGVSGAARNACAAICVDGQIRAACEQERLTRVRRVGSRGLPVEAVDTVLELAGQTRRDVSAYVVAETDVALPSGFETITVDHHRAHAATAFFTSPFSR